MPAGVEEGDLRCLRRHVDLIEGGLLRQQGPQGGAAGAGTVLGLVVAGLLVGPKALESANQKIIREAPSSDDQFARYFERLVEDVTDKGKKRLVVFIDELDRCTPQDVVATLVDLKTFLDQKGCVFVVAADRDVLEVALKEVPQAKPVRDDEPYYSTPGAFLDKIFQHQVALPPLRSHALTGFARTLVADRQGLWADLRSALPENRLFDDVVYTLIPAHVRSPRRAKVLLNNYATNVRVAEARGFAWLERAAEIAKLTVFQTEFPTFATDLISQPRLVELLLDRSKDRTPGQIAVLARYEQDGSAEGPAGEHLVEPETDLRAARQADARLRQDLLAYILKTQSADIPDPRPDLWYLQGAGEDEGIADPKLGQVLDYASDTAPTTVISAFEGQAPDQIRVAARLLAQRSDAEHGPGKDNLITAACGLVEFLDEADVQPVAAVIAPSILVVSRRGDLRAPAIPGALTIASLAANQTLVDSLIESLYESGTFEDGLLLNVVPVLTTLDDRAATSVQKLLISQYGNDSKPIHHGLRSLPENAALRLWRAAAPTIASTLDELCQPPAAAAPVPAAAAARAPAAATAVEQPEDDRADPSEVYSALLDAVERRSQFSDLLLSAALTLGQRSAVPSVYQVSRSRAEDLLPRLRNPDFVSQHALHGLAHAPSEDWPWWASHYQSTQNAPLVDLAVLSLVQGIPSAPMATLDQIPTIAATLVSGASADYNASDMVASLQQTLTATAWDDAADGQRRRRTHETVNALSPLLGKDGHDLLAADIAAGIRNESHTDTFRLLVHRLVTASAPDTAKSLDLLLGAYEAPASETAHILEIRIRCRQRYSGTPFAATEIAKHAGATEALKILNGWLGLKPPIADLLAVLEDEDIPLPSEQNLTLYAEGLGAPDRTALWIALDGHDAPREVTARVAQHGLDAEAIAYIRQRLDTEKHQVHRSALIDRLTDAPLADNGAMRTAACELALRLLDSELKGDAIFAADLVIAAGGPAHGTIGALRAHFQRWEDSDDKMFKAKNRKTHLQRHNLVRHKKGKIERIGDSLRALGGGDSDG